MQPNQDLDCKKIKTENMSQQRVGWRPYTSPFANTVSTLLTSLYGAWNGDTTGTSLDASIFGAWNAEASGTSLDTSIFAVYNADGDANDSKGTKHGTAQGGLTYTTGKINQAFQFNGSNAYIQLPNNSFNFTGDFSASLWVNFPSMAWQNGQLIDNTCWDSSGSGTSGWRLYYLYGSLGFYIFRENGLVQLETYSLNQANVWYHIVITSSSSGMKIYLNGALSVSNTSTTKPNYPNVVSTRLGASRQNSQFTTCKMDGVSTWSKELTPDEVTQLYNSGNGAQYPYSSQSLPSSNDSVGTNHGSLMNGVAFSTGKIGNAFTFDGVNDYVSFPTNSWNSLVGTDLTISLWVKFASTADQTLISNMSSPSINVWSGWEIRLVGGRPTIYMWNNSGTGVGAQGGVVSTNTWYHIVATRKKGSRTRIYINGVLAQTDTNTPDPSINGTYYPNIGHLQYSSSYHGLYMTNGSLIDSVNLWSKEISADEVTQLYNLGTGAQYPFSSQTLPSVNNQLGVDNATLMNGCSFGDGKIGKAFTFDGINDYVALPNNSLNFTGDFSISLWVYLTAFPSEQIPIGNYYESSPLAGNSRGWMIYMSGQNLYWIVCGSSQVNLITSISSFQNTWKQITITFKNGVGSKIYFDGSLVISNSSTITPIYNSTQTPFIGKYQYGNGSSFGYMSSNSKVDGLAVWQKELTQAEVTELYNSGAGKQITATPIVTNGLVLNLDASRTSSYPGSGTTWTDISGSGNNGTMVNGPVFGTASGGVITFDGVNDYVQMSNTLTLGTNQFTIEFWINNKYNYTSGNYWNTILSNYLDYASSWNTYLYIGIYYGTNVGDFGSFNSNGDIYLINSVGNFIMNSSNTGKINITNNQWTHVCFVRNGNDVSTYKNGVKLATINNVSTTNNNYSGSRSFKIGGGVSNTQNHFGDLSNKRIYNTALTDAEVLQNFNVTKSRFGL